MKLVFALALLLCFDASARIPRDRKEIRAFRYENACPSTGLYRGRCDGWQIDHVIPLCAGGLDKRSNMHWLSVQDHKFKTIVDVRECRQAVK